MALSSYSLVSFDLDGTLFRRAALHSASRGLGIAEKWDACDEMRERKRITWRECLECLYKLLAGKRLEDIMREVSKVEVIKNVRETVVKLQGHGLGVILLTDNPDFLCSYFVEQYGFNGYVASKVGVKDGVITGEIEPLPDKSQGLKKYCRWLSIPLSKCVHVGDWVNDLPVFRIVSYSIALNPKSDTVRKAASYAMETDDLLDVYRHLQGPGERRTLQ